MSYRVTPVLLVVAAASMLSVAACGVPKSEHEKIVHELEQVNQEVQTLNEQLSQTAKDKEAAQQQLAQLQSSVRALQKDNEALKAKLAGKKPVATKTPLKTVPKKS